MAHTHAAGDTSKTTGGWSRTTTLAFLGGNVVLSGLLWLTIKQVVPGQTLQTLRLEQVFGSIAFVYLYAALLAAPLTNLFTKLPFGPQYMRARYGLGLAAFYFALLHVLVIFVGDLGGLASLGFLTGRDFFTLAAGLVSLVVLALFAISAIMPTGSQQAKKLRQWGWWLAYPAAYLVLIHLVFGGLDFGSLNAWVMRVALGAVAVLLILEAMRLDGQLQAKMPKIGRIGVATMVFLHVILFGFGYVWGSVKPASNLASSSNNASIHSQHLKLAQQAQQQSQNQTNTGVSANGIVSANSSLAGDSSLRYTVNFEHGQITAGQPAQLSFKVYNASSGEPVDTFQTIYEKNAHLIITNDALTYYSHIHPTYNSSTGALEVETTFPKDDNYRLYMNYQPLNAIEQQVGYTVKVGQPPASQPVTTPVDTNLTKTFDGYKVSLDSATYQASKISVGQQTIKFTIKDAQGQPVKDLRPYLGAFGHMAMVNQATYDFIHVHPTNKTVPGPNDTSGPEVEFMPLGLYGPIKPGTYRLFTQFNPSGNLILTEFTVEVQ